MPEYSLVKIAKNDPNILICIVAAFVCIIWGLEIYFIGYALSKREGLHLVAQADRFGEALFWWALAAVAFVYAAYRFSLVTSLFESGIECAGVIDKIAGQEIFFSFDYCTGERCSKKIGLGWGTATSVSPRVFAPLRLPRKLCHWLWRRVRAPQAGSAITVLCDRYDSEKAIIKDFYEQA
ncbi:MAG: hypothetical protein Ta2A_24140 [Treponemataceae bacterium]|nr:MAG: hypothetical protein Ta2A_24140 [Treponemataceae bacterium]